MKKRKIVEEKRKKENFKGLNSMQKLYAKSTLTHRETCSQYASYKTFYVVFPSSHQETAQYSHLPPISSFSTQHQTPPSSPSSLSGFLHQFSLRPQFLLVSTVTQLLHVFPVLDLFSLPSYDRPFVAFSWHSESILSSDPILSFDSTLSSDLQTLSSSQ